MTYSPQGNISFQCPTCRKQFTAPASVAGRQVRCSGCSGTLTVPKPGAAPPAPPLRQPVSSSPGNTLPGHISPATQRSTPPATSAGATKPPQMPPVTAGPNANGKSRTVMGRVGAVAVAIVVVAGLANAFRSPATQSPDPSETESREPLERPRRGFWGSTKTKTVQLKIGTATITDDPTATSHVRVTCNNGLVIDADWKRNAGNEFGYDIYEPSVSRDYNRLAVMMTARGIIAAYLRGEYD